MGHKRRLAPALGLEIPRLSPTGFSFRIPARLEHARILPLQLWITYPVLRTGPKGGLGIFPGIYYHCWPMNESTSHGERSVTRGAVAAPGLRAARPGTPLAPSLQGTRPPTPTRVRSPVVRALADGEAGAARAVEFHGSSDWCLFVLFRTRWVGVRSSWQEMRCHKSTQTASEYIELRELQVRTSRQQHEIEKLRAALQQAREASAAKVTADIVETASERDQRWQQKEDYLKHVHTKALDHTRAAAAAKTAAELVKQKELIRHQIGKDLEQLLEKRGKELEQAQRELEELRVRHSRRDQELTELDQQVVREHAAVESERDRVAELQRAQLQEEEEARQRALIEDQFVELEVVQAAEAKAAALREGLELAESQLAETTRELDAEKNRRADVAREIEENRQAVEAARARAAQLKEEQVRLEMEHSAALRAQAAECEARVAKLREEAAHETELSQLVCARETEALDKVAAECRGLLQLLALLPTLSRALKDRAAPLIKRSACSATVTSAASGSVPGGGEAEGAEGAEQGRASRALSSPATDEANRLAPSITAPWHSSSGVSCGDVSRGRSVVASPRAAMSTAVAAGAGLGLEIGGGAAGGGAAKARQQARVYKSGHPKSHGAVGSVVASKARVAAPNDGHVESTRQPPAQNDPQPLAQPPAQNDPQPPSQPPTQPPAQPPAQNNPQPPTQPPAQPPSQQPAYPRAQPPSQSAGACGQKMVVASQDAFAAYSACVDPLPPYGKRTPRGESTRGDRCRPTTPSPRVAREHARHSAAAAKTAAAASIPKLLAALPRDPPDYSHHRVRKSDAVRGLDGGLLPRPLHGGVDALGLSTAWRER